MPILNFKTNSSPKLGQARPDGYQLSPEASRALLGSPRASPSLKMFFARQQSPPPPPRPGQSLKVPLLPSTPRAKPAGPPDMWSSAYLALYAHYACVGLVGGILTTALQPYCLYVIEAPPVIEPHSARTPA